MNLFKLAALAGVLLAAAAVFQRAGSAAPPTAAPADKAAPAEKTPAAADAQQGSLALRYARAQLRFAELTLKKAQEMNRKVPRTLAPAMISLFADDVDFAKMQLENTTRTDDVDPFQRWVNRAEIEVRAAEGKLKRLTEANRIVANTYSAVDFDRARAGIDVARLRLERGRSLANAAPDVKLAWQVEMLSEGLNRLYEMTSLSVQNRLSDFF